MANAVSPRALAQFISLGFAPNIHCCTNVLRHRVCVSQIPARRTPSEQLVASNVVFALSGKLVQQTSMVNQFVAGNLRNRTRVVRVNQANIALSSNKQTRVSTAQLGDTHQLAKAHAQSATRTVSRTARSAVSDVPRDEARPGSL